MQTFSSSSAYLLLAFVAVASGAGADRCYYCEEDDKVCRDPVDVSTLPSRICSMSDFTMPRSVNEPKSLSTSLAKVYTQDVSSRSILNATFECMKITVVTHNKNMSGVFRGCIPKPTDVQSNCDFLKEDLKDVYKVQYCSVCNEKDCNYGNIITPHIWLIVGLISMFIGSRTYFA